MARQSRPLKSSFWDDDKVALLSLEAQLLLAGLITKHADDDGRFVATPQAIHGAIFPLRDIAVPRLKRWMAEIERLELATTYRVGAGIYGFLPNWGKHQKVPHPSPSTLPAPPEEGLFAS
jgi:hypothetical protein